MPFYPGGNLCHHFNLPHAKKVEIAKALLKQMAILLRAGVIYTDVKLENVLVDLANDRYHFSDFGGCKFDSKYMTTGFDKWFNIRPYFHIPVTKVCSMKSDIDDLCKIASEKKIGDQHIRFHKALDKHSSRALGLLLWQFFSVNPSHVKEERDQYYTMEELKNYAGRSDLSFDDHQKEYTDILKQMLGLKGEQLTPQEAFEKWCQIA